MLSDLTVCISSPEPVHCSQPTNGSHLICTSTEGGPEEKHPHRVQGSRRDWQVRPVRLSIPSLSFHGASICFSIIATHDTGDDHLAYSGKKPTTLLCPSILVRSSALGPLGRRSSVLGLRAITPYPCEHAVRAPRLTHANMLCGSIRLKVLTSMLSDLTVCISCVYHHLPPS